MSLISFELTWNSGKPDKPVAFHLQALHQNYTVDQIHELTSIDHWFLHKLDRIVEIEKDLNNQQL